MPGNMPTDNILPFSERAEEVGLVVLIVLVVLISVGALLCLVCKICESQRREDADEKPLQDPQVGETTEILVVPTTSIPGSLFSVMPRDQYVRTKGDDPRAPLLVSDWLQPWMQQQEPSNIRIPEVHQSKHHQDESVCSLFSPEKDPRKDIRPSKEER